MSIFHNVKFFDKRRTRLYNERKGAFVRKILSGGFQKTANRRHRYEKDRIAGGLDQTGL
jgi:hypothetical protein